jgi:hypothetical protein
VVQAVQRNRYPKKEHNRKTWDNRRNCGGYHAILHYKKLWRLSHNPVLEKTVEVIKQSCIRINCGGYHTILN